MAEIPFGVIAGGPIGRIPAQRVARQELAKGIYSHQTFWHWLLGRLSSFYDRVGSAIPGGWWATVAIAAVLVGIATVVMTRIGPVGRSRRQAGPAPLGGASVITAGEHRELARRRAADGDHSGAIVESVRAIAAELEERGLLAPGPARTADELAREASALFPGRAAELAAAARQFDDVCYGERAGTPDGYARVQQLDQALAGAKPAVSR